MNRSPPEIAIHDLSKRYGSKLAVDHLSLALPAGRLCCLLGRNGAGKTTTIHTIMGLRNPTSGDVRIRGTSVRSPAIHRVRRSIGYLPEQPMLYEHLTGREFLEFMAELHGVDRTRLQASDRRLEELGMAADADALIRTYSMGTRKKIAFLAAILHDPAILILDEPTGALDAVSSRLVKRIMEEFRDRGRLVLFTTHIMEIAERMSDQLAILRQGSLRFAGTVEELRQGMGSASRESLEDLFIRMTEPEPEAPPGHGGPGPGRG